MSVVQSEEDDFVEFHHMRYMTKSFSKFQAEKYHTKKWYEESGFSTDAECYKGFLAARKIVFREICDLALVQMSNLDEDATRYLSGPQLRLKCIKAIKALPK